jgi:hypothetical protein
MNIGQSPYCFVGNETMAGYAGIDLKVQEYTDG